MAAEATSKDGEKLDQILSHLGVLRTQQDALKASQDALGARVDAMETCDKARKDAEEKEKKEAEEKERADAAAKKDAEEKARKDAEEKERADAAAKKDSEEKAKKDSEEKARKDAEEREREDKARKDAATREDADRPKFIEIQRTVDEIAQAFGDNAGPPRWMHGETVGDYTRRLLTKYKPHSKAWKDKDLTQVHDSVLDIATAAIRADAIAAAALPEFQSGKLIARESKDKYGRTITKFYGDARIAAAPFSFNGLIRRVRLTPVNELRRAQ